MPSTRCISFATLGLHAWLVTAAPKSSSSLNIPSTLTTTAPVSTVHPSTVQASSSLSAATTVSSSPSQPTGSSSAALQSCAARLNGQVPSPTPPDFDFSGNVRRYFIAAEEEEWDYVLTGWDNWLGVPIELSPRYQALQLPSSRWLKALYRGYTDETFTQRSEQPLWQGTQGPTIRSEVGDLIEILFLNNLTKNYATMHSMGLEYTKVDGEGADYPNNTIPGANVTLPEGGAVPPTNGNPGIAPAVAWSTSGWSTPPRVPTTARHPGYHSYVALQQDSNAGLIGPQITYAQGAMDRTMATYREFTLLYMIYNEADSWLSGENQALLHGGSSDPPSAFAGPDTPGSANATGAGTYGINTTALATLWSGNQSYPAAPSFYTLSGYLFANNPTYEMCLGDPVIWYVNAYGAASHVFHMHGNGFTYEGNRRYAVSLNDGVGKTLVMNATGAGKWQVLCHVDNHHSMGMVSDYQVYYEGQCPLAKLG
ncbi:Multicopper oxidase [Teratosphaeria destructans]|uniref:Multicopper oxidase n=1 Tax=Teratosphaeria destructans TaxID=418781 RepID=A0A9W7SRA7_9PEZI|nr:Multicopper oxidase [Teratosphaeria destructans]